jgi:hypothetical protein
MSSAGYSGTPLPRKLGIKDDTRLLLVNASPEFLGLLGPLPEGARLLKRVQPGVDIIVFFVETQARLVRSFDRLRDCLVANGVIWVAWPKRASGVSTDLTENVIRDIALSRSLVDTKVCAISEVWSGLRLVRRLKDRT